MLEFGRHEVAVMEVVECLRNFDFLTGREVPIEMLSYVRRVDYIDCHQLTRGMGGRVVDPDGVEAYHNYLENREAEARAGVRNTLGAERAKHVSDIWPSDEKLLVGARLTPEYYHVAPWIAHDLYLIMLWRAGAGRDNLSFWERAFQVYLAGGMPVGYDNDPARTGRNVTIMACFPGLPPCSERPPSIPSFSEWVEANPW